MDADEAFCTGTAVGVAPVGTITYQDYVELALFLKELLKELLKARAWIFFL
jgi:branched-subunit amino acid aminotransferase/4-amino-4-deoxychorismate lyase